MLKELFEKRLLRKIKPDENKVKNSIKISEQKIGEAERLFQENFFNQVIISSYISMFHAARALLYKDGIQEKSHYALFIYIREKYSGKIPKSLLNSFDIYKNERHEALYGFDYKASKEDAEFSILNAKEFLEKIKFILENETSKEL